MTNPLFVGVDVHRKTNTFCLMDESGGQVMPSFTLDNNRPGTQTFVQQVAERMEAGGFSELQVAAEATSWYWFHFLRSLQEDALLAQWPLELFALNPRLTARFKQSYVDMDKDDPLDAFTIADRLRFGRDIRHPFEYDEAYLALRFLTRYRFHLVHNLAREKGLLHGDLVSEGQRVFPQGQTSLLGLVWRSQPSSPGRVRLDRGGRRPAL